MKISVISRLLCLAGGLVLIGSLYAPLWRIELEAPQYPEGLALLIYPDKIAGDVEIINGLNHYIGMKTLHTEDFIEFTLLPYIIGFFIILCVLTAALGFRKMLFTTLTLFIIFGIVSMVDFYRWNYDYGHDLDPSAAIKVPGMAYQPPLIGYKQLLNFGAYSIPDTGGWLFIACGLMLLLAVGLETRWYGFRKKALAATALLVFGAGMVACAPGGPEPIQINTDKCHYCKMTISNPRFGAEVITEKGRVYKFDDIFCVKKFQEEQSDVEIGSIWVHDYSKSGTLIDAQAAHYVYSDELHSPMRGNHAAFTNKDAAQEFAIKANANIKSWSDVHMD